LPERARKRQRRVKPVPVPLCSGETLYVLETTNGQSLTCALAFSLPSFQIKSGFRTLQF